MMRRLSSCNAKMMCFSLRSADVLCSYIKDLADRIGSIEQLVQGWCARHSSSDPRCPCGLRSSLSNAVYQGPAKIAVPSGPSPQCQSEAYRRHLRRLGLRSGVPSQGHCSPQPLRSRNTTGLLIPLMISRRSPSRRKLKARKLGYPL